MASEDCGPICGFLWGPERIPIKVDLSGFFRDDGDWPFWVWRFRAHDVFGLQIIDIEFSDAVDSRDAQNRGVLATIDKLDDGDRRAYAAERLKRLGKLRGRVRDRFDASLFDNWERAEKYRKWWLSINAADASLRSAMAIYDRQAGTANHGK